MSLYFARVLRAACLISALAALSGCALSHQQIRKADAVVAAARPTAPTCTQADHCAEPSPFLAQAHKAMAASTPDQPVHFVTLLDHGESALAARISLIRAARKSIDLQTYIWANDDVGNLVLDALVKAARRGVQVHVLADQLFSFQNLEQLAKLARSSVNLELRLYNPTFDEAETSPLQFIAGGLCCFSRFNQRMHNKLLLIDDAVGITGGRNYENRYFGWDPDFDYRDRDVLVAGPAAHDMADTFDLFWHHPRSVPLTALRDVNRQILADGPTAPGWTTPRFKRPARVARVRAEAEDPDWLQQHLLSHSLRVGRVDYFSDLPDKTDQPRRKKARELTLHIMRMIAGAKHQIVLQTPYLILSDRAQHIFELLHQRQRPPRVIVSTNSLASTDAFFSYAMSYKHKKRFLKDYGFEIYELKPHPTDADVSIAPPVTNAAADTTASSPVSGQRRRHGKRQVPFHPLHPGKRRRPAPLITKGVRIGLHAKSIVVDDRFAMVGTHNFDPRSDHYNTESGVIVYSTRFATALRTQILRDTQPRNAWTIAPRQQDIPIISPINQAISTVSSHLPWFDLWPFRYATSFDLKTGCKPLAPADPGFYKCYKPVGDFPGVDLPFKTIYTRLVTGFGFGLSGIL
ncbi:MAG TPA: phospholipase D family protein [Oleiagrimonas sp.]|nr:phospholipase D family protein [Oleiagrimonas sp.]